MFKRRLLTISLATLLAVTLLLPATPALADGDGDGVTVMNENYTVKAGETVEGNLIIFNGNLTVEAGGRVEGSVTVWNGSADVEGTIEGDLVVSNGDIRLRDDAWVQGDVVCSWGCDLKQEGAARIDGGVIQGMPVFNIPIERWRSIPVPITQTHTWPYLATNLVFGFVSSIVYNIILILAVTAIAALVTMAMPQQVERVGQAVTKAPWASFGYGLLTLVVAVVFIAALVLTICLLPIAALGGLALGAASLFGWICIGALVGRRLLQAFNKPDAAPVWATALGALFITTTAVLLSVLTDIPSQIVGVLGCCLGPIGWLLPLVIGCLGLGGVVVTIFGTKAYPLAQPASTPSDPADTEAEEAD